LDYTFAPEEGVAMDEWQANDRLVRIAEREMNYELDQTAEWLRNRWM
jgi:hypothetical protein